jgi:hypothetical protein
VGGDFEILELGNWEISGPDAYYISQKEDKL